MDASGWQWHLISITVDHYLCLLYNLHVRPMVARLLSVVVAHSVQALEGRSDPFLGPKGVRSLLVLRGVSGYAE